MLPKQTETHLSILARNHRQTADLLWAQGVCQGGVGGVGGVEVWEVW